MLMLDKSHEVSRVELKSLRTPDGTDTWKPVPHSDVADVLLERAGTRGLNLRNERYSVLPGALYPAPNVKQDIPGARFFASLDFDPIPGLAFPSGCAPSAGIRNSTDKSFALSILCGARVFICANGVLSAEHVISRKHTSRLDLQESIDKALDCFMDSMQDFNGIYERLRGQKISRIKAHSLIVELADAGAFASSEILPVVREYEHPRHEEFKERNAWNLYQAATELMKAQSPARQADGFKALNAVLLN